MPLEFKNKDTAARFEALVEKDRKIHIAGLYSGSLSNITPDVAERMIATGDNQVAEKQSGAKYEKPKDEKSKDDKTVK